MNYLDLLKLMFYVPIGKSYRTGNLLGMALLIWDSFGANPRPNGLIEIL